MCEDLTCTFYGQEGSEEATSATAVVTTPVDYDQASARMLPILLMVGLQLWAIFGTDHHPVSMPVDSAFGAAIVQMIRDSEQDLTPVWPYPERLDFSNPMWSLMSVIETFKTNTNIVNDFNYNNQCPQETFCQDVFDWPKNKTCGNVNTNKKTQETTVTFNYPRFRYWCASCWTGL